MLQPDSARKLLEHMNLSEVARAAGLNPETLRRFAGGGDMRVKQYSKLVSYFEKRYFEDGMVNALDELAGSNFVDFVEEELDENEKMNEIFHKMCQDNKLN